MKFWKTKAVTETSLLYLRSEKSCSHPAWLSQNRQARQLPQHPEAVNFEIWYEIWVSAHMNTFRCATIFLPLSKNSSARKILQKCRRPWHFLFFLRLLIIQCHYGFSGEDYGRWPRIDTSISSEMNILCRSRPRTVLRRESLIADTLDMFTISTNMYLMKSKHV